MISDIRNTYPHLNSRALGWLAFLHQKATTPDDWSEDGKPHDWWDQSSTAPMCSFPRFDLQESTYAIGLMSDQTPAWQEVYAEILNELAERSLTYWAAVDWLSQFGADPKRKEYPPEWRGTLIPEEFWGEYDTPGWVANGIEPWGLQPDPIGADGNLFFRGWLNLTQSLHAYVSGEDKWNQPFLVAGVDRARFEWTQHRLVDHLVGQWAKTAMGTHCENTKVWPFCLSAAGLGLQMYDVVFGKSSHQTYQNWLSHTTDKYYGINKRSGVLEWAAMYYDPIKEHIHKMSPLGSLGVAFYAIPQAPEFAEILYRSAVAFAGWDNPSVPVMQLMPEPRMMAIALFLAREFDDQTTHARLRDYAETHFEPRYFGTKESQFGYWFKLGESWPRGQLSALALCADVAQPGAWRKLFREPNLSKYGAPTVTGVDFPALSVAQAWNDEASGMLQLHILDGNQTKSNRPTSFRVKNLPDVVKAKIYRDGVTFDDWRVINSNEIEINTDIGSHSFQIYTAYQGQPLTRASAQKNGSDIDALGQAAKTPAGASVLSSVTASLVRAPACPCCTAT